MSNERGKNLLIEDWMFDLKDIKGSRLTDTSLHLYALIYAFTKHGAGYYIADRLYASKRLRVSESAIKNAFKQLSESGLIRDVENLRRGSTSRRKWIAVDNPDDGEQSPGGSSAISDHVANDSPKTPAHDAVLTVSIPSRATSGFEGFSETVNTYDQSQILTAPMADCADENLEEGLTYGQFSNPSFKDSFEETNPLHPSSTDDRLPHSIQSEGPEYQQEICALMDLSLNKNATLSEVSTAYYEAISRGYTPQEIHRAYGKYVIRYRNDHDTPRYAMRLDRYLKESTGLRFDMPKSRKAKAQPSENYGQNASIGSFLTDRYPEYKALCAEHLDLARQLLRERAGKKFATPRQIELEQQFDQVKAKMAEFEEANKGSYEEFLKREGGTHVR